METEDRSPSHTVGLEPLLWGCNNFWSSVAIPRGGLRTIYPRNVYHVYYESPSHPVGLELGIHGKTLRETSISRHPTQWAWNWIALQELKALTKSPSHTVGLEQVYRRTRALAGDFVIIPHGGLGTRSLTKWVFSLMSITVTIPHGGLRTCIWYSEKQTKVW